MSKTQNPVGWFEIHVADLERAKDFYEAVFKRSLRKLLNDTLDYEIYAFDGDVCASGATGALVKHPMGTPSHDGTLIYFSCEDCAIEAERAAHFGGQVRMAKASIGPHGFVAIIEDSEGNSIGLHSTK